MPSVQPRRAQMLRDLDFKPKKQQRLWNYENWRGKEWWSNSEIANRRTPPTLSSHFFFSPLTLVLNAFRWWFVHHAFRHQQWRPLNPFMHFVTCLAPQGISVCDPVFTVKTWENDGGKWFVQGNWWAMSFICQWPHLHLDCPSRVLCVHPWLHLSETLKSEPNTNLWMKSQKYFRRSSMKRKLSSGCWVI